MGEFSFLQINAGAVAGAVKTQHVKDVYILYYKKITRCLVSDTQKKSARERFVHAMNKLNI